MTKGKKTASYVIVAIIFFLIIPELALRYISTDLLGEISDFTSLWGTFSPFLSMLIFLGLSSIILAVITVALVGKIYRVLSRSGGQ